MCRVGLLLLLLLPLLLSHFSRVQLCATPETAAHQASPSLGFSRQEHWSGGCHLLQCMKVKSESEVAQSCLTLATPWTAAHQAPPSMGFSRQKYWSGVPLPSPRVGLAAVNGELGPKRKDETWQERGTDLANG